MVIAYNHTYAGKVSLGSVLLLCCISVLLVTAGCSRGDGYVAKHKGNAMYYWRTEFSLDTKERSFLTSHSISTLYLRFFDVILNDDNTPQPQATIAISDSLPKGIRCIPVVYIVNDVFRNDSLTNMAKKIAERVMAISETNSLPKPDELQIDCDWSESTRDNFFGFMRALRKAAADRGMKLSSTIRLHQLSQSPPAADYGVLMLYNTGNVRDIRCTNPVFSLKDILPYIKYVAKYPLPLSAAYPNFRWYVLYAPDSYGKDEYRSILYGCDPDKMPEVFRKRGENTWTAISSMQFTTAIGRTDNLIRIVPGMTVKELRPDFNEVIQAHSILSKSRPDINNLTILFDLNTSSLNIYSNNQYEKILSH